MTPQLYKPDVAKNPWEISIGVEAVILATAIESSISIDEQRMNHEFDPIEKPHNVL